jgi:hypothetical protein
MVLGAIDELDWRGRSKSLSWFVRWLALSLALHLPLTPLLGLLGIVLALAPPPDDAPPPPPLTEIPVELLPQTEEPSPPPAAPEPTPEAEAAAAVPAAKPPKPPKPPKKEPLALDAGVPIDAASEDAASDAGFDAASDAALDGGLADARSPDAAVEDAGPRALDAGIATSDAGTEPADEGKKAEASPLAVAGGRGVVDPNANVTLLIDSQRLRGHPLGPRVGKLLAGVHQWRDFFGPTGIDPVRDIDRIYIAGPQLRDSSSVVALIQHRIPKAKLRAALDALVARDPEGEWLDGGTPVAKARADRAARYFVTPSASLLIVTPESTLRSARRIGTQMRLPTSPAPEVVTAHVKTPWRAFIGTPLNVPRTLRWAAAHVTPDPSGGATVRFVAEDADEATAQSNARLLERSISDGLQLLANATNLFALLFGDKSKKLVEAIEFHAEGERIVGTLTFTEAQVVEIVDRVGRLLGARVPRAPGADAGRSPRR